MLTADWQAEPDKAWVMPLQDMDVRKGCQLKRDIVGGAYEHSRPLNPVPIAARCA